MAPKNHLSRKDTLMRRDPVLVCALTLFILTISSVPSGAQTTAAGPYLATPAWDQRLACDTPATCPRFVVLSNWNGDAVLDRETGLVWERSPRAGNRFWSQASLNCTLAPTGGRYGWRLPTIQELASLGEPDSLLGPRLPAGHPFVLGLGSSGFWSATTEGLAGSGGTLESAYGVDFGRGFFTDFAKNGSGGKLGAWCVRGGSGLEGQ
jgi:hypothetical protein